jgi:hypothetical protein
MEWVEPCLAGLHVMGDPLGIDPDYPLPLSGHEEPRRLLGWRPLAGDVHNVVHEGRVNLLVRGEKRVPLLARAMFLSWHTIL